MCHIFVCSMDLGGVFIGLGVLDVATSNIIFCSTHKVTLSAVPLLHFTLPPSLPHSLLFFHISRNISRLTKGDPSYRIT